MGCSTPLQTPTTAVAALSQQLAFTRPSQGLDKALANLLHVFGKRIARFLADGLSTIAALSHPDAALSRPDAALSSPRCRIVTAVGLYNAFTRPLQGLYKALENLLHVFGKRVARFLAYGLSTVAALSHPDAALSQPDAALSQPDAALSSPRCRIVTAVCLVKAL